MTASISHFLTAAIKFSCYSSDEIGLLCCFFFNISGSSSCSVIHANVQHRSQGSLLPDPWSERERPWKTLVTCLAGEKKTQEGSLFLKVLSPQIFVNINTRQTFLVRDQPRSQGSLLPAPWSERGPGRREPWERGWPM